MLDLPIKTMLNIYIILAVIPISVCSSNTETVLGDVLDAPAIGPLPQIATSEIDREATTTDDADAEVSLIPNESMETSDLKTTAPRCASSEVAVWSNNAQFSLTVSRIAHSHLGNARRTVIDLIKEYPILTEECAACFGANVACGASKCWMYCMLSSFSSACLDCTDRECNPALKTCLGVEADQMPPRPTEDMEQTTSTSTFAPRKRAVRRPVAESTTSEPSVEVHSNETLISLTAQAPQQNAFFGTLSDSIARYWYFYFPGLVGLLAWILVRLTGSTGSSNH